MKWCTGTFVHIATQFTCRPAWTLILLLRVTLIWSISGHKKIVTSDWHPLKPFQWDATNYPWSRGLWPCNRIITLWSFGQSCPTSFSRLLSSFGYLREIFSQRGFKCSLLSHWTQGGLLSSVKQITYFIAVQSSFSGPISGMIWLEQVWFMTKATQVTWLHRPSQKGRQVGCYQCHLDMGIIAIGSLSLAQAHE